MAHLGLSPSRPVVVDASALTEVVGWRFLTASKTAPSSKLEKLQAIHGKDPKPEIRQFEALWEAFAQSSRWFVTPSILQEAWRARIEKVLHIDPAPFTEALEGFLKDYPLEESFVSIETLWADQLTRGALPHLGVSDAGVLYLAREHQANVLTEDRRLRTWVEALNLQSFGASSR